MNAQKAIILARKNIGGEMESSARLCLSDAIRLYDKGDEVKAQNRAIDSLRYSVGVFHPDYRKAAQGRDLSDCLGI